MTFTDNDLKRLMGFQNMDPSLWEFYKLEALLTRLEAAEDAIEQAYRCTPNNKEYYEKWRKAAGK